MRTSILASLFGISLIACAGQIDSPGGGDDDIPATCGNNAPDTGEGCDDGNNDDGDGCSATCQNEVAPRLDVSVDKATVATELASTNMITVTLTSGGGFTGAVTLTASAVDDADAPLPTWTVALDSATLTVPSNGTATAVATLTIPGEKAALSGKVKFAVTGGPAEGTLTSQSAITALDQVTIPMTLTNNLCAYAGDPALLTVKVGTKVRWMNTEAAGGNNVTIHINGSPGLNHQPDPGSIPGAAYEQTPTAPGTTQWYCHAPGPDPGGANRPVVTAVQ